MLALALDALARGWVLTPLRGKIPVEPGWQKRTATTEAEVRAWLADPAIDGFGIVCGPASGLLALDVDPRHGGDRAALGALPETCTQATPSGGEHILFTWCAGIGNGRGALPPGIDVRGNGGQVRLYGPTTVAPAELPEHLRELLKPRRRSAAPTGRPVTGWGLAALQRECDAVAATGEGNRNERLNLAAFRLGQIAAGGSLDADVARESIIAAAVAAGLPESEARPTAERAIRAGAASPRAPAALSVELVSAAVEPIAAPSVIPATLGHVCRDVLTPGAHRDDRGGYTEQSASVFATQILDALPPGTVYRRDVVPGVIVGARFHQATADTIRRVCDEPNVRTTKWVKIKTEDGEPKQIQVYDPISTQDAGLILDHAAHAAPEIKLLTSYPVVLPDRSVSPPGYHAASGTFYAGAPIEPEKDPRAIREHFLDLVADFPFEDEASMANFFGLLLTPMLRPLVGKTPLHLVTSPQAGTGKSRLIEDTLGVTYRGRPLPSSSLPERQEDRGKWLTALLLGGATLLHLDNLAAELDSGNLASILTSSSHMDRVLGSSNFPEFDNVLTIAASGNNTQLSSEIARRTVVVRLIYRGPGRPEDRSDFRHTDTTAYALAQRLRTLACLSGAVALWDGVEAPTRMGSYERWSGIVGGVLAGVGITAHLGNRADWRGRADAEARAVESLVREWFEKFGTAEVTARELANAFPDSLEGIGAKPGSATSAGMKVAKYVDRTFEPAAGARVAIDRGWSLDRRCDCYSLRDQMVPASNKGPSKGPADANLFSV